MLKYRSNVSKCFQLLVLISLVIKMNIASDIFIIGVVLYILSMQVLKKDAPFIHKAIATLAISIVCDILDYCNKK